MTEPVSSNTVLSFPEASLQRPKSEEEREHQLFSNAVKGTGKRRCLLGQHVVIKMDPCPQQSCQPPGWEGGPRNRPSSTIGPSLFLKGLPEGAGSGAGSPQFHVAFTQGLLLTRRFTDTPEMLPKLKIDPTGTSQPAASYPDVQDEEKGEFYVLIGCSTAW